jgi:hypothetical protein
VFIDETAVSTNMARDDNLRGRSAPQQTDCPMVVDGTMTGKMFLAYVEAWFQCCGATISS